MGHWSQNEEKIYDPHYGYNSNFFKWKAMRNVPSKISLVQQELQELVYCFLFAFENP